MKSANVSIIVYLWLSLTYTYLISKVHGALIIGSAVVVLKYH
jgi:hypothetical protein